MSSCQNNGCYPKDPETIPGKFDSTSSHWLHCEKLESVEGAVSRDGVTTDEVVKQILWCVRDGFGLVATLGKEPENVWRPQQDISPWLC
jgi:hypothetical protein